MKNPPVIEFSYTPSGQCPVQAEGTVNGYPFYFKARGNRLRLFVANKPGGNPLGCDAWSHEEPCGEEAFAAGYANTATCTSFIEIAAALWARTAAERPA